MLPVVVRIMATRPRTIVEANAESLTVMQVWQQWTGKRKRCVGDALDYVAETGRRVRCPYECPERGP